MGLLTIIRKNRFKEKEMRILFLCVPGPGCSPGRSYARPDLIVSSDWMSCSGLDNAGKTTILKKLNGEDIRTVSPTLGFEIKTFAHKG